MIRFLFSSTIPRVIKSCGIDIVELNRFKKSLNKRGFIERVFAPEEIHYCVEKKRKEVHFAARWAAKEAFIKATQNKNLRHKDIWVTNSNNGNPKIYLSSRGKKLVKNGKAIISLSHSAKYAVAVVILE